MNQVRTALHQSSVICTNPLADAVGTSGQAKYISLLEDSVSILGDRCEGKLLLDATGVVVYVNGTAEALVSEGVLKIRNGMLCVEHRQENERLQSAVAQALTDQQHASIEAAGSMSVGRPPNRVPLIVAVARNNRERSPKQASASTVRVVVTVIDPVRQPTLSLDILIAHVGFTPREAELAGLLAAGCDLKHISGTLGISYETVRSHVKSMTHKIGVRGQARLIWFLARLTC